MTLGGVAREPTRTVEDGQCAIRVLMHPHVRFHVVRGALDFVEAEGNGLRRRPCCRARRPDAAARKEYRQGHPDRAPSRIRSPAGSGPAERTACCAWEDKSPGYTDLPARSR